MIQHLFVNGCSFTAQCENWPAWGQILSNRLDIRPENYWNPGTCGAGNYFICNTTIDALEIAGYDPEKTLVLIMWSGLSRRDLRISTDFYNSIQRVEQYWSMFNISGQPDCYYICSGGISGSWLNSHPMITDLFRSYYLSSDIVTMCRENLDQMQRLQQYLCSKGYRYRFMCIHNFWHPTQLIPSDPEFVLDTVCQGFPLYDKMDFSHWLFTSEHKDGYYEFARDRDLLDSDNYHPRPSAHPIFVEKFLLPNLQEIL